VTAEVESAGEDILARACLPPQGEEGGEAYVAVPGEKCGPCLQRPHRDWNECEEFEPLKRRFFFLPRSLAPSSRSLA